MEVSADNVETPAEQWQDEMDALGQMPADEAFIYLIFVVSQTADEFQGDKLKSEAADEQQISTDQNLVNDMYGQYTSFGNVVVQYNEGDISASEAGQEENACVVNAQQDAAQVDYDLNNASVYQDNPSFQSSVESQFDAIFGGPSNENVWKDPGADPNNTGVTQNLWATDWNDAYPPTEVSQPNDPNQNFDRDPSGVQARTTAFQNLQDSFSGLSSVQQQLLKAQKSNMSMTQSLVHMFDSNYISQEKTPVQATNPS